MNDKKSELSSFLTAFLKTSRKSEPVLSSVQVMYRLAELEEEAARYYEGLAQFSDLPWVRNFAKQVALVEKGHKNQFLALAETAGKLFASSPKEQEPLPSDLIELMSARITLAPEVIEKTAVYLSEKDAIQFAIQTEDNTITLLTALRNYVPIGQHEVINQVLREEMQHKDDLEKFRDSHFKNG